MNKKAQTVITRPLDKIVMRELKKPIANQRYYKPLEKPRRYPLELCDNLHICLWSEDGKFKWTIAFFSIGKEGYDLNFVGDRPLENRVNWDHFQELIILGQTIANDRFKKSSWA